MTANAQADANIRTAHEQQQINMVNSYGPQGSVTYAADPNAPGGYSQTTTLNPSQQAFYDQLNAIMPEGMGNLAQALKAGAGGMSYGADLSGLKPGQGIVNSFDKGQGLQYDFSTGKPIQYDVGGDLDAARQQSIDAVFNQAMSRLNPQYDRQYSSLQAELANQGLSANSDAYRNRLDQFGRERTDAQQQAAWNAVSAGETAANNLFGRELAQGQFYNAAAGQDFGQNQSAAAFHNATAGQDFGQNLDYASFGNQAQDQAYSQELAKVQAAQTNSQINNSARTTAAMLPFQQYGALQQLQNGIGMPAGIGYSPVSIGPTDVLGAYGLTQQQLNANYQAKMQANSGLMGGLAQLGSAAIMASDRRLKRDVVRVGTRRDGLGVYLYRYLWSPVVHLGVMAQEVLRVRPAAVVAMPSGFLAVDYGAL